MRKHIAMLTPFDPNMPEIQGMGNVASLRQVLAQQEVNGVNTPKNLNARMERFTGNDANGRLAA